jgi:hypothetical protein
MTPLFALLTTLAASPQATAFEQDFTGKTLRFDYYHSGTAREERISLDQLRIEGDWPGSRVHLLDETNLGKYLFTVTDLATNRLLYSRGFASIYGEWETIGEAKKGLWRTFHESQRFPEPRAASQLTLKKRSDDGAFRELYSIVVDPQGRTVNRSPLRSTERVSAVFQNGPPSSKVDLLVVGDGYTAAEAGKYRADVERLVNTLFETEPFRSHRRDFNVWSIEVPSSAAGVTDPRGGVWNETPLGLSFNSFDIDRYVLTTRNAALREIAAQAPYDTLVLIANTRKYGGGGIFNLWATCSADTSQAAYVFVHELGHSFAGLADEYYTSQVAYEDFTTPGVEPWEPNVTALLDPKRLKWREFAPQDLPLPTPWNQDAYDKVAREHQARRKVLEDSGASIDEHEALFEESKKVTGPMLRGEAHHGKVGAFEGAGYQAKGLYRPEVDCIMFTRNPQRFCRVCNSAIERVIRLYAE